MCEGKGTQQEEGQGLQCLGIGQNLTRDFDGLESLEPNEMRCHFALFALFPASP